MDFASGQPAVVPLQKKYTPFPPTIIVGAVARRWRRVNRKRVAKEKGIGGQNSTYIRQISSTELFASFPGLFSASPFFAFYSKIYYGFGAHPPRDWGLQVMGAGGSPKKKYKAFEEIKAPSGIKDSIITKGIGSNRNKRACPGIGKKRPTKRTIERDQPKGGLRSSSSPASGGGGVRRGGSCRISIVGGGVCALFQGVVSGGEGGGVDRLGQITENAGR